MQPRSSRMTTNALDHDAPLPLNELSDRLSKATLTWLESVEQAKEEDDDAPPASFHLFETNDNDDEYYPRIHTWTSSTSDPDGFTDTQCSHTNKESDVVYILSDASGGHGDDVWAASRHISNLLVHECPQLLQNKHSSLLGLTFLELGAGGGIPSWTAMKCGARVVCTDQPIADRIRCLAESAQRNLLKMMQQSLTDSRLEYARQARVCPYLWGDSNIESILLEGTDSFDVIVAADCIYNPDFHSDLIDSIQLLLSENGVALLPFALHGNTNDENVWAFGERAKEKNFVVETLESQQLTPQILSMDPKRGLVHMIRLSRKQSV